MNDIFKMISHEKILIHDGFYDDLKYLYKNDLHGFQKNFVILFRRVVKNMIDFSMNELQFVDSNERLKKCKFPCYSLHLHGSGFNVRFLVTDIGERYLLLLAFNEKNGKRNSGYEKYIQIAYSHYMEWSGVNE